MPRVSALIQAKKILLGSASVLLAIGLVMIYSASSIYAHDTMHDSMYFIKRHLMYLMVGAVGAWLCYRLDYERLRRHALWVLVGSLLLLILVLVPHVGHATGGARRWIKLGFISFQPSEFLKIAMIFYMADFLERKKDSLHDMKRTLLPALGILGVSAGLVLKQPDLGTSVTIAAVVIILFFAAGFRIRYLLTFLLVSLPGFIYMLISKPYRRKRLLAFFNPWEDPRGVGYQITQSFLAFGSGGLWGLGLGESQQKMFFLPESHTDFIFAIIGEETGLLGALAVVCLFALFIFAGMVIVFQCKDRFSQLFTLGLTSLIALECLINIGVSIGALPTKGLSLPFISYGGTALIVNMCAVGFLLNAANRQSVITAPAEMDL